MKQKNLTMTNISFKNIKKKPTRSFLLTLLIAILIATIYIGTVASSFLAKGTQTLSDRLGADLIIVPEGYSTNLETILLRGEANSFFLPKGAMEKIKNIPGVEKTSPQTYLTTLRSACCSAPIQLMGIDFDNDFLIQSWLNQTVKNGLLDNQVIIGSKVKGEIGDKLTFFGKELEIAGKLEPSGLGFDASAFLNMNTIQYLANSSRRVESKVLVEDNELISAIMVKLTPGYVARDISRSINKDYAAEGIFSIVGKKFVNDVSKNLYGISNYIGILIAIICFMSFIILGFVFSLIINERKKEVNLFRILGATRKQLIKLLLLESFLISLAGTILGLILGNIGVAILIPIISKSIHIIIAQPNINELMPTIILYLFLGISIGPLFSLFTIFKITRNDIFSSVREAR